MLRLGIFFKNLRAVILFPFLMGRCCKGGRGHFGLPRLTGFSRLVGRVGFLPRLAGVVVTKSTLSCRRRMVIGLCCYGIMTPALSMRLC